MSLYVVRQLLIGNRRHATISLLPDSICHHGVTSSVSFFRLVADSIIIMVMVQLVCSVKCC